MILLIRRAVSVSILWLWNFSLLVFLCLLLFRWAELVGLLHMVSGSGGSSSDPESSEGSEGEDLLKEMTPSPVRAPKKSSSSSSSESSDSEDEDNPMGESSVKIARVLAPPQVPPKRRRLEEIETPAGPSSDDRIAALEARIAVLTRSKVSSTIRPIAPVMFDGSEKNFWVDWVEQAETWLDLGNVPLERRVDLAAQYLDGSARKFWRSRKLILEGTKTDISWDVFVETLASMYDSVDRVDVARTALAKLEQGIGHDSLSVYINEFLNLTSELAALGQALNDNAQIFEFRKGLTRNLFRQTMIDPATHKGYTVFATLLQVVLRMQPVEIERPATFARATGPVPSRSRSRGRSREAARGTPAHPGGPSVTIQNPSAGRGGRGLPRGRGGRVGPSPNSPAVPHLTHSLLTRLAEAIGTSDKALTDLLRNESRCYNCASADHGVGNCPFPWGTVRTRLGEPVGPAPNAAPPPPAHYNGGIFGNRGRGGRGRGRGR